MVVEELTRQHQYVDGFCCGNSKFCSHAFIVSFLIDGYSAHYSIVFDLHA